MWQIRVKKEYIYFSAENLLFFHPSLPQTGPHRLGLNNTNPGFTVLCRPIERTVMGGGADTLTHTHTPSIQYSQATESDHHSHFPNIPRLIGSGCSTDNDPLFSPASIINHFFED